MATEIFDKFDTDKNGTIDKEEARNVFIDKYKNLENNNQNIL